MVGARVKTRAASKYGWNFGFVNSAYSLLRVAGDLILMTFNDIEMSRIYRIYSMSCICMYGAYPKDIVNTGQLET